MRRSPARSLLFVFLCVSASTCATRGRVTDRFRPDHVSPFALVQTEPESVQSGTYKKRASRPPTATLPTAEADAYSVGGGQTLTVGADAGVLANDLNPSSLALSAAVVGGTSHGTLTLAADGGFTYVNDGSSATSDSFSYEISTILGDTLPASVTITVVSSTPAPVTADDNYSATQSTTLTISAASGVLANDTTNGGAIVSYGATTGSEQTTIGAATPTSAGGSVSLAATGGFSYTPAGSFTGADTFRYVVGNGTGTSIATVHLTVNPLPPIATNDSYSTAVNTTLDIAAAGVLSNDTLRGGAITSFGASSGTEQTTLGASTATASGGTVKLNANGSFQFTPASSFSGSDSFKYVLTNAGGTSKGTVSITVQGQTADFTVTSPGFFYEFTGVAGENPVLTLQRGRTYVFNINTASIHPFQILDAPPGSVTNNNISKGTITFAVPNTAATYQYECSVHHFGNTIQTTP